MPRRVETRCITHEKSRQTLPGAEPHPEHPGRAPDPPGELQEAKESGATATTTSFLSRFWVKLLHTVPSGTSSGFEVSPKSCGVLGGGPPLRLPLGRTGRGHLWVLPAPGHVPGTGTTEGPGAVAATSAAGAAGSRHA